MQPILFVDLSSRVEDKAVRELMSTLTGWRRHDDAANERATREALETYQERSDRWLFGLDKDGAILGLIGVRLQPNNVGVIRQIVVHPSVRAQGLGRRMVTEVVKRHRLNRVCRRDRSRCGGVLSQDGL